MKHTTYSCNRCKAEHQDTPRSDPPTGWRELRVSPLISARLGDDNPDAEHKHLCPGCWRLVEECTAYSGN